MTATQEVVLRIKGDSKDAQNALNSVAKALNGIDASKAAKEFPRVSKGAEESSSRSRQALQALNQTVEGTGDKVAHLGVRLGTLGLKVGAAGIGTALGALGGIGLLAVDAAAKWEEYGVILGNVLAGGEAQAKSMLSWLGDFAKKTPYELDEVVQAAVKLSAYGIDATKVMQTLGDTAASMGKPLNEAVEALADAQTGEFERLKEFGLKALDLGNLSAEQLAGIPAEIQATGNTAIMYTDKMGKEQIAVVDRNSREMVTNTLTGIWNSRYAGGMEKLSHTWTGVWSNIKDGVSANLRSIGQIFLPHLEEWGTQLTTWMATTLNPAIQTESTRIADIWAGPGSFQEKLQLGWDTFDDFLVDLGVSKTTADEVKIKFEDIGNAVKDVGTFVKDLATGISDHWNIVKPILEALALAWIAIKIQAGLAAVAQIGALTLGGAGAAAGAGAAGGAGAAAGAGAAGAGTGAGLGVAFGTMAANPKSWSSENFSPFGTPDMQKKALDAWNWMFGRGAQIQDGAYAKNIGKTIDFYQNLKVLGMGQIPIMTTAGRNITQAQATGMNEGVGPLNAAAAGARASAATAGNVNLQPAGMGITTGMGTGMWAGNPVVTGAADSARSEAAKTGDVSLVDKGLAIIQSLSTGMLSFFDGPLDWATSIKDKIVDAIKNAFVPGSPSEVMMDLGRWVSSSLVSGVTSFDPVQSIIGYFGGITGAMKEFGSGLWGQLSGFFGGGGGGGVDQWISTILQAMGITGTPTWFMGDILAQMMTESGGNPNAFNDWDSNAMAGDPTGGLMQNIGSAMPGRLAGTGLEGRSMFDPLASLVASMRYVQGTYGGDWSIVGAPNHTRGYAYGGISTRPGLAAVSEDGEPEIHLTKQNVREFMGSGKTEHNYYFDQLVLPNVTNYDELKAALKSDARLNGR